MARYTFSKTVLVVVVVLSLATVLQAGTGMVISHSGSGVGIALGVRIGSPIVTPPRYPPPHRHVVIHGPPRHRFVRLGPPCIETVVVPPPVVRRVVVEPMPTVTINTPVSVEEIAITVWITNSNGSKTTVRLTRQGPWYVGPRGEYYAEMPTNEQLRIVYGF